MSLRKPTTDDLSNPFKVIDVLVGFYDAIVGLVQSVAGLTARYVNVSFAAATTDVLVFHGLGAPVQEWWVVNADVSTNVWQSATVNTAPQLYLILQSSAIANVKLRVA